MTMIYGVFSLTAPTYYFFNLFTVKRFIVYTGNWPIILYGIFVCQLQIDGNLVVGIKHKYIFKLF